MREHDLILAEAETEAPILAFLFDCDGVLVDSEPALARIAAELLNARGLAARPDDFTPFIGTGEARYLGGVMEQYGAVYSEEIKDELYRLYIEKAPAQLQEVAGASALLKTLKAAGFKTAVVSSADRTKVDANLKALSVPPDHFDAVITGSDVERKKPWPDIYLKAAASIDVAPESCVVIEDAVAGVEAGKRGDMMTIGVTTSLDADELFEAGADYVVDRLDEIETIFGLG